VILVWWLSLQPSQSGDWQADNQNTGWAEVNGDQVIIHDFRNCAYTTEEDYTCAWEMRSYNLSKLKHLDIAITWWGSPWIAHPILSFDFGDQGHVAMSIETRDLAGQSYSAIRGFFRQYRLIYIAADERDGHAAAHQLTNNCTTNIAVSAAASRDQRTHWDWRIFLNGKADEMMYEKGQLVTDSLPLPELKARAHINEAARAANGDPHFSARIREGRPGFEDEQ